MKTFSELKTRREFLRTTLLGTALSSTVPAFLASTFAALEAQAQAQGSRVPTGRDSTILVVLQLAGGNDGINTVVPFANDYYRRARPRLALPENKVLKLNDSIGLHHALTGLKDLFDAGRLTIVQGAGYPNPNRSHFRSTEIWQTGSDSNRIESYGWLGRFFDNACAGADPAVGITIGRQMPQAFAAKTPKGISLENPQNYRFLAPGRARPGEANPAEVSMRELNEMEPEDHENSGGSVVDIHGPRPQTGSSLAFIERTALDARVSSDEIHSIIRRVDSRASYPASQLGNSLQLVAKLIAGGLPTRVFYLSQGGYDTHTNQAPAQERLLKDLADSAHAFAQDLVAHGDFGRVLMMTFSEFGRRVAENASGGTDHGAAAPMFLVGGKLQGGLLGTYPSLAPAELFQGDLRHTVDFRSVYASILENWVHTPSAPILGKQFPLFNLT